MKIIKKSMIILVVLAVAVCLAYGAIRLFKSEWFQQDTLREEDGWELTGEYPSEQQPEEKETVSAGADQEKLIVDAMKKVSGKCQWGYKIFATGEENMTKAEAVPSASVIKVFIMEYAFDQIEQGKLKLTDSLTGGTTESLLTAMITRSDNDATNTLIEKFGMENLNRFFRAQGYQHTEVQRKMLDTKAQEEGKENYTSVADVMKFLDTLYQNKESEPYRTMLGIMKKQEVRTKIPKKFPTEVVIANKTGELSNVENDIGIIFGDKSDYAVVFLCSELTETGVARDAISDAAYNFYLATEK